MCVNFFHCFPSTPPTSPSFYSDITYSILFPCSISIFPYHFYQDPQTAEQREKEEDASQDPNPIKAIMHALEANAKAAEDKERVASIVAVGVGVCAVLA